MTTKKQRRAIVAAKTEVRRVSDIALGEAAIVRSRDARAQRQWEAERSANQRKAKAQMREVADAKKAELIPDNMLNSYDRAVSGSLLLTTEYEAPVEDAYSPFEDRIGFGVLYSDGNDSSE